ncbi:complement receptor type 1-like [Salarias fasciatus]|uniref:Complement receptor type 1-like n=1 Tax=Salarias fasciatus TaxID=181472 RepID=A0A672J2H7_SALFA|nr:complement receptor type 1-like [Salarias fasciatus]
MRTVSWNILLFSLFTLSSAQVQKWCGAPVEYPHTRLDNKYSSRLKFSSGDKVYYNCAENFTPSTGSRSVQCQLGKWTKLTLKCEKKSCGNAGDLPHGQFLYQGNSYIGEKVYASCNKGYTLKGLNYLVCTESGWTGEFPSCVEGTATCSPPAVSNSVQRSENVSEYQLGDNVTFACARGFLLDGAQQVTCGPGGRWQPEPPLCLPSPTSPASTPTSSGRDVSSAGRCGAPPPAGDSHASLADKYTGRTSFSSGEKVYYVCDVGYAPAVGSRTRLCSDGEWTPLRLQCERKLCGTAGELTNGRFVYSGVAFGDKATAVCEEGYRLVGRATRNCLSGGWDGRNPECEAVECDEPPEVKNAEMKGLEDQPYKYRSVVQYRCLSGTLFGQKELWCTKNGTWSDPPPQCQEVTCPSPDVSNAYWTKSQYRKHQFRSRILIECKKGFYRKGPSSVSCNIQGQWEPDLPTCLRKTRRGGRG